MATGRTTPPSLHKLLAETLSIENSTREAVLSHSLTHGQAILKTYIVNAREPGKNAPLTLADINSKYPHYKVSLLGGNNNRCFLLEHETTGIKFVLQLTRCNVAAEIASAQLSKQARRPYFADFYAIVASKAVMDEPAQKNPYAPERVDQLIPTNFFPTTLEKKISETEEFPDRRALAKKVCQQISTMLTDFTANKMTYSDLKYTNFAYDNDQVILTDRKALSSVALTPIRGSGPLAGTLEYEMTKGYLSADFSGGDKPKCQTIYPGNALEYWNKEYSYLLAIILYIILTQQFDFIPKEDGIVDFRDPVFEGKEGQRWVSIIKRLSERDARNRMHHSTAASLLQKIENENAFAEELKQEATILEILAEVPISNTLHSQDDKLDYETMSGILIRTRYDIFEKAVRENEGYERYDKEIYNLVMATVIYNHYANPEIPIKNEEDIKLGHWIFSSEKGKKLKEFLKDLVKNKEPVSAAKILEELKDISQGPQRPLEGSEKGKGKEKEREQEVDQQPKQVNFNLDLAFTEESPPGTPPSSNRSETPKRGPANSPTTSGRQPAPPHSQSPRATPLRPLPMPLPSPHRPTVEAGSTPPGTGALFGRNIKGTRPSDSLELPSPLLRSQKPPPPSPKGPIG